MGSVVPAGVAGILAAILHTAVPLSGTIRSADGRPIAGATVIVYQGREIRTATSDAAGAYNFADVALPATVEVSARGFAASLRDVNQSPADFTLTPASVRESVVVTAPSDTSPVWRDGTTGQARLSREDLERQPAVTPDESLRVISGFSLFRRSTARASNPTTHGVTMRGLSASGASRGLVMLDGIPLNEGFGGWVTWTRVPPDAIAGVDVGRGAEGDVFGSDALGGVIALKSRTGGPDFVSVAGEAGSSGLGSADFAAGLRRGRWSVFGAAGWFTNDGEIPVEPASRGPVDQPASADWTNVLGRVDAGWDNRRLSVSAWGSSEERGNGTEQQWNRMNGSTFAASFNTMVKSTSIAARLSTGPNDFDQSFTAVAAGRATETLTSIQYIDLSMTRAVIEAGRGIPFGYIVGRGVFSRASSDFKVETPAATTIRRLRDDSDALSLQAGFRPTSRFTVGAGVRHEWRASPEESDDREGATVGHASGSWLAHDAVVVRGTVATSHRWPTLNELARDFRVGNVLTTANAALLPERARSGDVGVTFQRSQGSVSVAGFWSVVDNAIASVTQSTGATIVRQRQNAGEAHASGVEIDAEARASEHLRLRGSAVFMNSTFQDAADPALEGKHLPQVPKTMVSVGGDVFLPWSITATAFLRFTGEQYDDDRNQFLLANATQIDLRIAGGVGPGRRLGWHFVMENAADARIEVGRTPLVTLAPGRVVRAGLGWKF
jgi:outer membrane receptor protein involved in Fe transport